MNQLPILVFAVPVSAGPPSLKSALQFLAELRDETWHSSRATGLVFKQL